MFSSKRGTRAHGTLSFISGKDSHIALNSQGKRCLSGLRCFESIDGTAYFKKLRWQEEAVEVWGAFISLLWRWFYYYTKRSISIDD